MAGLELALPFSTRNNQRENYERALPVSAEIREWKVEYGRFIICSSSALTSTHHPSLAPLKNRLRGTWISTGAAASVKLVYERSADGTDDAVLTLRLQSRVLEVHYISKIQFSWPQVSCMSGFPARGSRAVLLSYKDGEGKMQKFALRFASICETENFMNVVKEIMETGSHKLLQYPEINSEISSEATLSDHVTLAKSNISFQDSELHEGLGDGEAVKAEPAIPPGFRQLMNSIHPEVSGSIPPPSSMAPLDVSLSDYLDAATEFVSGDMKTQFVQYLEGTSFTDLLATVENVISELGGNMLL